MASEHRRNNNASGAVFLTVVVVVAVLYFARALFIPLALAVLFTFLLAPLVRRLRHWGLGRVPSVAVVVLLSFLVMASIGMIMASQLGDLARKLPEYQQNVRQKFESLRNSGSGFVNKVSRLVNNVTEGLSAAPTNAAPAQSTGERPPPIEIHRNPFSPMEAIQKILGSVLGIMLTAGVVVVFVIFMLLQQEDLRDRLIGLAGAGRINATTQLLDEAARRVSRYLVAQVVINASYGALVGLALSLMRVPNPLLWAMLAALLRYVPYLGIWVAAAMPAAIVFAVKPGWVEAPLVLGIYFGIDLLMYNVVEPLLYGTSTGVSPIAILVTAVFWAWLWGPVGLLLATPLTVCLVVTGRYVPQLQFLSVMLSDEIVLTPETRFYQRLLALDAKEATEIAEDYLKGKSLADLYDDVIIPALSLAEEERHRGRLEAARQQFILQNTRLLVEDLGEHAGALTARNGRSETRNPTQGAEPHPAPPFGGHPVVLCAPARDQADEIAALMLVQLLRQRGVCAKELPAGTPAGEALEHAGPGQARIACVTAVPPFGFMHARYLCRRLRAQFLDLKLIAAVLTEDDASQAGQHRPAICADEVASSLKQALAHITSFLPLPARPPQDPALAAPGGK